MKKLFFWLFLLFPCLLFAQKTNTENKNFTYKTNIRSVKFHLAGLFLSLPIIELRSDGALELSFDDLEGDVKDYVYTIVHCDADWKPSDQLTEMDYLDGFTEEKITEYDYSYSTIVNYTHYRLLLPNNNMRWLLSGNYLLKVYEDEDEKSIALVRRFMVVDPLMQIEATISPPSIVSKLKTHHEIDFVVSHKGIKVNNPQQDIKVVILQNGRWDNAIFGIKPQFFRGEKLIYDHQNKIVFPAGKEFRFIDLRSLRYRSNNVEEIQEYEDGYEVFLFSERDRSHLPFVSDQDINGSFVIENLNENNDHLESDYANVVISLRHKESLPNCDVYLFGEMTDWQIKEEFKLKYFPDDKVYEGQAFLKQGFYNYLFAKVDKSTGKIDLEALEGNWYETENNYTILVYYRPFGARYDRLVAAETINSAR